MDTQTVFIFVVIAIFLVGGGVMLDQAYEENLEEVTQTNETVNVSSFDTAIQLENSNIAGARYDQNITVRNSTGSLLDHGTDYDWHQSNGTIEFLSGSADLSAGEDTTVTYGYGEPTGLQKGILSTFSGWIPVGVLVLAVVVLLSLKDYIDI